MELDEGDEQLKYQGPKHAMNVRGCKDRSRTSRIDEREDLDFAEKLRAENAIEIPDGYGVAITTDAEHPDVNRIRRDGDSLHVVLSDFQVTLSPNAPELQVIQGNNERCTFR